MRCSNTSAAVLLRKARARHGISQRRLALRAGTSQDAISRIERGVESPTLERLAHLLMMLGEHPKQLSEVQRALGSIGHDGT